MSASTRQPNGREAFHKAMAAQDGGNPYDLVLMDMQMPRAGRL